MARPGLFEAHVHLPALRADHRRLQIEEVPVVPLRIERLDGSTQAFGVVVGRYQSLVCAIT